MTDLFYRSYEDQHRGSRELIKSRLLAYLPFIAPLPRFLQPAAAIDIGCGRGEWLELLQENGFNATGVDLDDGMLSACHEHGLHVQKEDGLQALRKIPDASMALVSAFHVVEHIPFDAVRSLIHEALRVLRPGGLLILETPNPENLSVGACNFYQDPSHQRPLPPKLLHFSVDYAGFCRSKVVRLQESAVLHDDPQNTQIGLLDVLNGVSPDYSIVAQKQAPGEILTMFDRAFQTHYGFSLDTLAQRYDWQTDRRLAHLQEQIGRIASHIAHESNRIAQRFASLEERIAQAEARAAHHARQTQKLLNSTSWRITAPLRWVWSLALSPLNLVKQKIKPLLRKAGRAALRHPVITRFGLALLNRMPHLKARLRHIVHPPQEQTTAAAPKPVVLSSRARDIHAKLQHTIRTKDR